MAGCSNLESVLSALPVSRLDDEWIKSVWEKDFIELDPLPGCIEDDLMDGDCVTSLKQLRLLLDKWICQKEDDDQNFWVVLVENDFSHHSLIAFLAYLIQLGSKKPLSVPRMMAGLLAASNYFKLISVPGSGVFKVFHPMLFQQGIDMLKICTKSGRVVGKCKTGKKNQRGVLTKFRKPRQDVQETMEVDLEDEDEKSNDDAIPSLQMNSIRMLVLDFLKDLVQLLNKFSLRQSESSIYRSIQVLTELIQHDTESDNLPPVDRSFQNTSSILGLVYTVFLCLSNGFHGSVSKNANVICKNLLPSLLMLMGDSKAAAVQTITKKYQLAKDHAVAFLCHLLKERGNDVILSIRTLLQHMCMKVPDKAEYRARVSEAVVVILRGFPTSTFVQLVGWLTKITKSSKVGNRVFALDLICLLLLEPMREPDEDVSEESLAYLSHKSLICLILEKCSDVSASVRSRAIVGLSQCLSSKNLVILKAVQDLVSSKVQTQDCSLFNSNSADQHTSPDRDDNHSVLSMLRRRAGDEKVNVRRVALQAIESVIRLGATSLNVQDLATLQTRCRDPALSVRKQAMMSLSQLLIDFPTNHLLHSAWLNGVIPLVKDRESSLQEKCLDNLEEIILQNITSYSRSNTEHHRLTWEIISVIAAECNENLRHYLQSACYHWARMNKIKLSLAVALETHVKTENNKGAWMLLAEFGPFLPKFKPDFVICYWKEECSPTSALLCSTQQHVLKILGSMARWISPGMKQDLLDDLKLRLKRFDSPPEMITTTIRTLRKLCDAQKTSDGSDPLSWCFELLQSSEQYLSQIIFGEIHDFQVEEDQIICHLFTLGEVAQLCTRKIPKRVFMLVQSIIAMQCITSDSGNSNSSSSGSSQPKCSQQSMQLLHLHGSRMSSKIQAHAFTTLGKFCLQNEDLAEKCVAALARELETSPHVAIRNNVIVVMCDLCIRYTTLVDRYVSNIAACLKDKSALIRKQTLTLLTRLLQEDYLKWKGILFYRFITTLLDDNSDIRHFAEFCLVHVLLVRHPNMLLQHFVECIFHFNSHEKHSVYNKFTQSDREKEMFSLKGKSNFSSRHSLYRFMLNNMADQHKFQLAAKINQEILGGVIDGVILLDAGSIPLLQDALLILSSTEIKLSSLKSKPLEENLDEQDMAVAVMESVKKTLITQVMKKNVVENIVPIVTSLKHMLETNRSPLLKNLMLYLQELMKDFKNEIQEILSADKQLASEIEFDLRKFEEQQLEVKNKESLMANLSEAGSAKASPKLQMIPHSPQQSSRVSAPPQITTDPQNCRLAKKALLNSTKKAMKKVQQLRTSMQPTVKQTSLADSSRKISSGEPGAGFTSPEPNLRAISTPTGTCQRIDFACDENISIIPSSSSPKHSSKHSNIYDFQSQACTPRKLVEEAEYVVYMSSPDTQCPKPRKWNITPSKSNMKEC